MFSLYTQCVFAWRSIFLLYEELCASGTDPIPMEFFVEFDRMVGPRLTLLAERLASNQTCSFMDGR